MNTIELRINNFIELADKGMYQIYDAHDLVNIDSWGDLKYCSPVPLTEEWLLKFSFKWEGYHPDTAQREYYEDKSGFSICKKDNRFYYDKTKIETVHHLQNLYYFITGSELVLSNGPEAKKPAL